MKTLSVVAKFENFFLLKAFGLLSAFPIFIIPTWNIIFLNRIRHYDFNSDVHPDYTFSLGFAVPLPLASMTLIFLIMLGRGLLSVSRDKVVLLSLLATLIFNLITSQNIKSVAFSASLWSFYFACRLSATPAGRAFIVGYVRGLILFAVLHAISILRDGFVFSQKTQGISFFSLEIYQALVSYSATITLLFGCLLLHPIIVRWVVGKKPLLCRLVWLIAIIAILMVEICLTRRVGFLLWVVSIMIFVNKQSSKWFSFKIRMLFCCALGIFLFAVGKIFIFEDLKALDFSNMIAPRLNLYIGALSEFFGNPSLKMLFGVENNWATLHNTFLDVLHHSGVVGALLAAFCIFQIVNVIISTAQVGINEEFKHKHVLIFISMVLFFDNCVNTMLSLPYYSVSAALILSSVIVASKYAE